VIKEPVHIVGSAVLKIALPNKGRLADQVRSTLADAGLELRTQTDRAVVPTSSVYRTTLSLRELGCEAI
jgi:ATP phosphoribosyltransferase